MGWMNENRFFHQIATNFPSLIIKFLHITNEGHVIQIAPDVLTDFENIRLVPSSQTKFPLQRYNITNGFWGVFGDVLGKRGGGYDFYIFI